MTTPLPTNLDSTYVDNAQDPTVQAHQRHHDALHGFYNSGFGRYRPGGYYAFPGPVNNNLVVTQSREYATPVVVTAPLTLDRMAVEVVTAAAGAACRLGWRLDSGTGQPGALVSDVGTVSAATAGIKEVVVALTLAPGLYWLTQTSQGGTPSMRSGAQTAPGGPMPLGWSGSIVTGSQSVVGYYQDGVTDVLPSTFTLAGVQAMNNTMPVTWFRAT